VICSEAAAFLRSRGGAIQCHVQRSDIDKRLVADTNTFTRSVTVKIGG
jgi:hypothetical protein